jgi:hypothetical protein
MMPRDRVSTLLLIEDLLLDVVVFSGAHLPHPQFTCFANQTHHSLGMPW